MSVPVRSFREERLQAAWDRLVDADRLSWEDHGMWPWPAVEKHGGAETKLVAEGRFESMENGVCVCGQFTFHDKHHRAKR